MRDKVKIAAVQMDLKIMEKGVNLDKILLEAKEVAHLIPGHVRIKPILHFTEIALWNTYQVYKLPYCILGATVLSVLRLPAP